MLSLLLSKIMDNTKPFCTWYIIESASNTARLVNWGTTNDQPAHADFDGDGRTDIAVFRPAEGNWYIRHSGGGVTIKNWGQPGDLLIPGDYNGDKRADIAIFRPTGGEWWILNSGSSTATLIRLGEALNDVPAPSTYIMP